MKVAFILKGDPFSWKAYEAIRVAMALAMSSEVYFILIKDGVYALTKWKPENLGIHGLDRLLQNVEYVNIKFVVEDTAAEERGIRSENFVTGTIFMSMEEIKDLIKQSEVVCVW